MELMRIASVGIKVAKPNFNKKVDVSAIQATWLGHAVCTPMGYLSLPRC